MNNDFPNLFIIGSMKSGSTSLHEYLNLHPDIHMSAMKEPGYFVEEKNLSKGERWYLNLFSGIANEKYVGESSTHYTKLPTYKGVPERIKQFCADPYFIYIMRDPIDRTISHYWHNVRKEGEHKSLIKAVKSNKEYLDFSYYAMQLKPYIDTWGRDKIYVLTFENMIKNTDVELQKLFDWMGLDQRELLSTPDKQYNQLPDAFKKASGLGFLYQLRHSVLWGKIARLVPEKAKKIAVSLSEKDTSRNDNEVNELIELLRESQKSRVDELRQLLDMEFPEWKTTLSKIQ